MRAGVGVGIAVGTIVGAGVGEGVVGSVGEAVHPDSKKMESTVRRLFMTGFLSFFVFGSRYNWFCS
jgi:hypothetical protein